MSFLDFAKNVGRQLFDRDDVAADRIKENLGISLSPIANLQVAFDDGCVTLSGECTSQGQRENAILLAGNVKGVDKVVADQLTIRQPLPKSADPAATVIDAPLEKVEFYEIKKGDTLSGIAKHFYGNAAKYPRIFEANREVIVDADKIYPGQKIRIPLD
ncbi:MAG: peptidoglycan-binding protein LysM [Gammaproteobacteria bacterium]